MHPDALRRDNRGPTSSRWSLRIGLSCLATSIVTLMAAGLTGLGIIPASRAAQSQPVVVSLKSMSFQPQALTVAVGTTVTWRNDEPDRTTHSVTGGPLASPDLAPGLAYSFTFNSPGSFTYHCRFHSYMEGLVTVTDQTDATTTSAPPPVTTAPPGVPPTDAANGAQYVGAPLGDGTFLAKHDLVGGVKVFHLVMAPLSWEVAKGRVVQGFAFNGVIPGPVIRANAGDRLRFVVENKLPAGQMTGVHWHGMVLPNDQDGVPGVTQDPIEPGQTYTYEWTAVSAGTHWYHAHMGGAQIGKGLYGPLQITARSGNDIPAAHDYSLMFGDTNLGFVLNGKSFPDTVTLRAKVGERVHIRLYAPGDDEHAIHLHGTAFQVVAQDGNRLPQPYLADTLSIAPGQTWDIVAVMTVPGKWALHCHKFIHSENDMGMTGMTTILDVSA